MPDAHRGFQRLFQRLQRITAIGAGGRYVVGDGRPAGKRDVVANRNVGGNDAIAAGDELPADLRRSAHHDARREKVVLAKVSVVCITEDIVQLTTGSNMS